MAIKLAAIFKTSVGKIHRIGSPKGSDFGALRPNKSLEQSP